MSQSMRWLERHTAQAPPRLRERVLEHADTPTSDEVPEHLATAAGRALAAAEAHPVDRSAALDLLAADALVTLALLAQAQRDPAGLHAFAGTMLQAASRT